jgi:hypothetical protein
MAIGTIDAITVADGFNVMIYRPSMVTLLLLLSGQLFSVSPSVDPDARRIRCPPPRCLYTPNFLNTHSLHSSRISQNVGITTCVNSVE